MRIWIPIASFVLFILIRIPFINREFVLEEGLFVGIARSIFKTGYPLIFVQHLHSFVPFFDRPTGLFFILAPFVGFFGPGEYVARIVPLFFSIAELIIILYLGTRLFSKSYSKAVSLLTVFLLGTHPFLIQNALMVHYEGVYSFFSTLFLLLSLEKIINKKNKWFDYFQLGIVFFFAFSIKYDPSLLIAFIVFIFSFLYFRNFTSKFLLTTTISVVSFLVLFYLYTNSMNYSEGFFTPIKLLIRISNSYLINKYTHLTFDHVTKASFANNYYILIKLLSWLSIPTILISIYSFLYIFLTKKLLHDPKIVFLLIWFCFFCTPYLIVGWPGDFPRYFVPSMPALFLIISISLVHTYNQIKQKNSLGVISMALLFSLMLLILAQIVEFLFLDHITGWIPKLQVPFFVIISIGIFIIIMSIRFKFYISFLLLVFLYLMIGQNTIQYLHDLRANYSLTNFYGISGTRDAARFLKNHFNSDEDIIFTYDPIAYYWDGENYDFVTLLSKNNLARKEQLIHILESREVVAFALPQIYYDSIINFAKNYNIDFQQYLNNHYAHHKEFGSKIKTIVYY